jgi:VIT1/CCC1 family predicted Fe2+/Mn2+ transporter
MLALSHPTLQVVRCLQKDEVDSSLVYQRLAERIGGPNGEVLARFSRDEARHALAWQAYTQQSFKPRKLRVGWILFLARVLGFTFIVKFFEKGEFEATKAYKELESEIPDAAKIRADEERHEKALMGMLDEERLKFVGAMVLGMNDALVELTGALAGFAFAMRDGKIVALAGLITGVSATLSMMASSYLSAKAEGDPAAKKSALYTGAMYLGTVALMVAPFLILPSDQVFVALALMFGIVVLIIASFNFYISVAKDLHFKERFWEMFLICVGVCVVSFGIGQVAKSLLGVDF